MKKIKDKLISIDTRSYVLVAILFLSLTFSFTLFGSSMARFIQSAEDLITSLLHWFFFCYERPIEWIFGSVPEIHVTVREFPTVSFEEIFNIDFTGLMARLSRFPDAFLVLFPDYNLFLYNVLFYIFLLGGNVLLVIVCLIFLAFKLIMQENDRPNGYISKPAKLYIKFLGSIYQPFKAIVIDFLNYMEKRKALSCMIIGVWLLNFNVATVILEIIAIYYYFITSFDFIALAVFLLVLLLDALILILSMPLLYWLSVASWIYYKVAESKGIDHLQHMEAKNCGFIKTLDIVVLIMGEPGTGKTTKITDMILSTVNIFKKDDIGTMLKYELYFPWFPFSKFREDILDRKESGEFFCLPNVEDYVDLLMDFHDITRQSGFLYGYDTDIFPDKVDVGNRDISLKEALKEYGKAFFEYSNPNPVIANFPIRLDGNYDDSSRLKLWDGDFFNRKDVSEYCHILNQDMLRHGVKVDPESAEIGMLGPSVIGWTEISKDLGNQNTNAHMKADSATSNAKNEKSIYSFMLARHAKTLIDNNVHIRFFTDDQRASNVMAAATGLMSILSIKEKGERKLALPGFDWIFVTKDLLVDPFDDLLLKRENVRGDITLSFILAKQLVGRIKLAIDRTVQRFGYEETVLIRQQGNAFSGNTGLSNAAGEAKEHIYYSMYMKVYANRFPSDIYSEAYATAQKAAGRGIEDIPKYKNLYPSLEELEYQRSRLTSDVIKAVTGVDLINTDSDEMFFNEEDYDFEF